MQPGDIAAARNLIATMRFSEVLEPVALDIPVNKRILVIAPHPDDELLGAGGLIILAEKNQCDIKVVFLTNAGKPQNRIDAERILPKLGVTGLFLEHPVREIDPQSAGRQIAAELGSWTPDIVCLPFILDDHPDHRTTSAVLRELCEIAVDVPTRAMVLAYQVYSTLIPNVVLDISDVIDKKISLLSEYETQSSGRDWGHYCRGMNAFNSRFLYARRRSGFAELFFMLPCHEYLKLCLAYGEPRDLVAR